MEFYARGLIFWGGGACYRNFTVYKLVSVIQCKISSVTTAKRQFVQAIVSLQKLSTSREVEIVH